MSAGHAKTRQSEPREARPGSARSAAGHPSATPRSPAKSVRTKSGATSATTKSGAAAAPSAHAAHTFRPGLDAAQVDRELRAAVRNWQSAEHCVVLWFAEFNRRRLHEELGYGSIHLYATEVLGFSQARSYQFLQLAQRLKQLPSLEKAVASGKLGWTKAQVVASVATPQTEQRWLTKAKTLSRRELQNEIGSVRRQTRSALSASGTQLRLRARKETSTAARTMEKGQAKASTDSAKLRSRSDFRSRHGEGSGTGHESELDSGTTETVEMPLSVGLSFTAEQFARYEALVAKLRQRGHRAKRPELVLVALENLLNNSEPGTACDSAGAKMSSSAKRSPSAKRSSCCHDSELQATRSDGGENHRHRIAGPSYQIHIQHCPRCETSTVSTSRGDRPIDRATLQTVLCDAKLRRAGARTVSTTPPRLRREVLERDRFRCRMPGCRNRHFLQVHHIVAKEDGGKHHASNLITLCGSCHRALHALGQAQRSEVLQCAVLQHAVPQREVPQREVLQREVPQREVLQRAGHELE